MKALPKELESCPGAIRIVETGELAILQTDLGRAVEASDATIYQTAKAFSVPRRGRYLLLEPFAHAWANRPGRGNYSRPTEPSLLEQIRAGKVIIVDAKKAAEILATTKKDV